MNAKTKRWDGEVKAGERFGELTVLREVERFVQPSGIRARSFLCLCDCGKEKRVRLSHLRHNRVRSCGHLSGERHGMGASDNRLYMVWRAMKSRCNWLGFRQARYYSGRGIKVCAEWSRSFIAFKDWAINNGFSPELTIDRIDNDAGYSPGNCRWVTQRINNSNRRNTFSIQYNGISIPFSILLFQLEKLDNYSAIMSRIKRGWNAQKAVDTPIRAGNYHRKGGYPWK